MTSSDIRDMIKSLGNEAECKVIYQDRKGGGRRGGGGGAGSAQIIRWKKPGID